MEIIYQRRSTNGRWGLAVVGNTPKVINKGNTEIIRDHSVESLGTVAGIETFRLVSMSGTHLVMGSDLEVVPGSGAVEVGRMNLQSSDVVTLIAARDGAIVKEYGYKRRSSHFFAVTPEGTANVPSSVLLALGLVEPDTPARPVAAPVPPSNNMFAALQKAGLV